MDRSTGYGKEGYGWLYRVHQDIERKDEDEENIYWDLPIKKVISHTILANAAFMFVAEQFKSKEKAF